MFASDQQKITENVEGVCFTCTLDSLSDEAPHEVGTVLAPVGASECVNLVKEAESEERWDLTLNRPFVTELSDKWFKKYIN